MKTPRTWTPAGIAAFYKADPEHAAAYFQRLKADTAAEPRSKGRQLAPRPSAGSGVMAHTSGPWQREEVKRLRMVIERDRSIVAMALTEIRKAIGGRQWLSEGGRGNYAYDDEDYQKEFGAALDEIAAAMEPLRQLAADWQNCPTDPLDITTARKGLTERFRALSRPEEDRKDG